MTADAIHPGSVAAPARESPAVADEDAAACTLLAAGKTRAAAEGVIRAHGPSIRLYLRSVVREPDVADDAYSLWSEWVLEAIARYEGTSSLRTWAYGVAHNAARRVRDDAFRRRRCSLSRARASRVAAQDSSSTRQRERAARALESIRGRLSLDDQGLLALRIDHGLDWDAVAAILSSEGPVSTAAYRKRFERLKERIRQLARESGILE